MSATRKVVVIGSGVGGAACAALLARKGFAVTVLERNRFVGGKAASYERDGFICDMGVHYTGRGSAGPLGEVARRVEAGLQFIKKDPFLRVMKGRRTCDMPLKFTGLLSLFKLARVAGVKPKNMWGAYRAFLKLIEARVEKEVEPHDETSLRNFLLKYTDDENFHQLIDIFCGLLLVIPSSEASAGEFIWSFSTWARAASCSYPKGGFQEIAKSFLRACERDGGRVLCGEEVKSVHVKNGRVLGVETEKGSYQADIVVSNAGIKKSVSMAGEGNFDQSYLKWVKSLKDSAGGVTVKYALDYKPVDIPIFLQYEEGADFSKNLDEMSRGSVPLNSPLFIPCPSFADPDIAPPGKHLLLAGTIVPESLAEKEIAEKVLDRVEQKMSEIFPGIEDHIIWKQRTNLDYINMMGGRGTGEVIGLAQRFDQVGKKKPNARMPIDGLYLVGCDAGGRGIGTEQAADSALKVSELIATMTKT